MAATESNEPPEERAVALRWASQPAQARAEPAVVVLCQQGAEASPQRARPSQSVSQLEPEPKLAQKLEPPPSEAQPGPQAVRPKQRSLASP